MAVLYSIPLMIKRDIEKSDVLLCAFLICQGLIALNIVFLHNETLGPQTIQKLAPFHSVLLTILYGLQGVLFLWYSRAMMGIPIQMLTKASVAGLATVLIVIVYGIGVLSGVENLTKPYLPNAWIATLLSVITGIYALHCLSHYDSNIRRRFSTIENIKLSWLWHCGLGFVCLWAVSLLSSLSGVLGFYYLAEQIGTFKNLLPMLLMSIMVVYSQTLRTDRDKKAPNSHTHIEREEKPFTVSEEQKSKLEDLMLRVKIYQDPELRLDGLADSMKMSPRSISALLNGYYQKNFYDFINYYRVLDAQEQLRNTHTPDKTIQRIFEDAGFNSKTTFNTLFKKLTGHTPSEYRKLTSVSEK